MKFTTTTITTVLVAVASAAPTSIKEACPAPGEYNSRNQYGCNPAHAYPTGQKCQQVDGCNVLVSSDKQGCPAPGISSSDGKYYCNPAHKYPTGQTCKLSNGCYILSYGDGKASCPAPGTSSSDGKYYCNPAHTYPQGQSCKLSNGCYILQKDQTPSTGNKTPQSNCPAPGKYTSDGKYSCNPAHKYPEGQTCKLTNGCYLLDVPQAKPADEIYAIKRFTERKLNGKDISSLSFNVSATNGGTLDFVCSPWDAKTNKPVNGFQAGTSYSCGFNSFFSFVYNPATKDGEKNKLQLTNVGGSTKQVGELSFDDPICRAGGSGPQDFVCEVPEVVKLTITMKSQ